MLGGGEVASRRYVPILKGKLGELNALRAIGPAELAGAHPLVEVLDGSGGDDKSRTDVITSVVKRLTDAWGRGRPPLRLDAADLEDEQADPAVGSGSAFSGPPAIRQLIDLLRPHGVAVVPVVRLSDPPRVYESLRDTCAADGHGALLRVTPDDLDDSVLPLDRLIETRVSDLGIDSPSSVDIVLDFGAVNDDNATQIATRLGRFLLGSLTRQPWRTVAVGAGAFPSDLSGVQANVIGMLPRRDKTLWQALNRLQLDRPIDFADYAVANPLLPVGAAFAAPPQLRYTTDEVWLAMKGRRQDRRGNQQFYDICRAIVDHEGDAFDATLSWGDGYINRAAMSVTTPVERPGNATTWRSIATSHHLAWVVRSLREKDEP